MVGMLLVAILMSVSMTACGDDDDDEPADPANHDPALIGTWEYKYVDNVYDYSELERITFKANGNWEIYQEYIDYEDDEKEVGKLVGTWTTRNNYVTMICTGVKGDVDKDEIGDKSTAHYNVQGNTLYLDGEKYFKK